MKKINLILFYTIASLVAFDKKSFDVKEHQDVKKLLEEGYDVAFVGSPAIESNGHQTLLVVSVEMIHGKDGKTLLDKLISDMTPDAEEIISILLPAWKKAAEGFKERMENPEEYAGGPIVMNYMTEEEKAKIDEEIAQLEADRAKFHAGTMTEEEKSKYVEKYFGSARYGGIPFAFKKNVDEPVIKEPAPKKTNKPGTKKDNPKA